MIKNFILNTKILREKIFNFSNFQQNTLNNYFLKNHGDLKNIKIIYDIGAHRGAWTKEIRNVFKKGKFYLFEANPCNNKYLELESKDFFNVLLSRKIENKFFYTLNATGDSYLKQNIGYDKAKKIKIKSNTLDNFSNINKLPKPNFIKIDTQGSEIDILKSAKNTLKNCKFILLECPLVEYNKNAPNISEYLSFMKSIKYLPVELIQKQIHKKLLVQIDILFKKND
tara:strand:+ start:305 stop:982 length:678 start_codon:yes stop_codon:yes gene_type:complete